jgi:hypothetical protein
MIDMKVISAKSTEHYQEIIVETGSWIFKKRTTYRRSNKSKTVVFKVLKDNRVKEEKWLFGGNGHTLYRLMNYLEDTNQLQDTSNL